MNIELKIQKARADLAKAKAQGTAPGTIRELEARINDLWKRLLELK